MLSDADIAAALEVAIQQTEHPLVTAGSACFAQPLRGAVGYATLRSFSSNCDELLRPPMNAPTATADFDVFDRITVNPAQCGGKPCIRGMRIRVTDVLGMLAGGATPDEILADFPDLEARDITASLAYAAALTDRKVISVSHHVTAR